MYCISISHKHASSDIRAQFAFSAEEQKRFIRRLFEQKSIDGCVILSTCNRSEIYFTGKGADQEKIVERMEQAWIIDKQVTREMLLAHCMIYDENRSIRHLYQVCCGMDSMVLGEVEIIRQVKEAYLLSKEIDATNSELNVIFQGALNYAKTITSETKITRLPLSIGTLTARAVVDFCRKQGKTYHVLVVGARGKIGSIVVRDLADFGVKEMEIVGTSRNHKAIYGQFADVAQVEVVDYASRYDYVAWADVVISATSSPHYTFTAEKVKACIFADKSSKKRLFIDLAVPGDMDVEIGNLLTCELKDIDYFKELSADNNLARISEMKKADLLLTEKVEETAKAIAFQNFLKEQEGKMDWLSSKNAGWLLYKLKDSLDEKAFAKVLRVLAEEQRD